MTDKNNDIIITDDELSDDQETTDNERRDRSIDERMDIMGLFGVI